MVVVFIEWLPWAGKSTLTKWLESANKSVVHELWRVIWSEKFPGNGKTLEDINQIDLRFIKKEISRMQKGRSSNIIFFDRSFFSHITYAYAYSKHMWLQSFKKTVLLYHQMVKDNMLLLPDYLIYMVIREQTSIFRQVNRVNNWSNKLPDFWMDKNFLKDLLLAYEWLLYNFNGKKICINWEKNSIKEQLSQVLSLTKASKTCWRKELDFDWYLKYLL